MWLLTMVTSLRSTSENETEYTLFQDNQLVQEFEYELLCQQRDITDYLLKVHQKINKEVLKAMKKLNNWEKAVNIEKLVEKWDKKSKKHPSYMVQMDIGNALQDWKQKTEKGILAIQNRYLSVINTGSVQISFAPQEEQSP